jgi:hypothetical protein
VLQKTSRNALKKHDFLHFYSTPINLPMLSRNSLLINLRFYTHVTLEILLKKFPQISNRLKPN